MSDIIDDIQPINQQNDKPIDQPSKIMWYYQYKYIIYAVVVLVIIITIYKFKKYQISNESIECDSDDDSENESDDDTEFNVENEIKQLRSKQDHNLKKLKR